MERNNIRSYLIGFFSSLFLIAFGTSALAAYQQEVILNYTGIQITLDGQAIVPVDAAGNPVEPFIINGTTYLPVRAVSNALGLGVEWDGEHQTVKLTSRRSYNEMTIEELRPLLQTVTAGKLTVVTAPDFAPYEFYSIGEDGSYAVAGFDISLANYIADYLGLELELILTDFDGALWDIERGAADLCIAGLSPTPDMAINVDFSYSYWQSGQSFICQTENEANSPTDVSIAVRKGQPALLSAVNLAISAAQSDGSLNTFIAYANDLLAQGEIYEGLISTE